MRIGVLLMALALFVGAHAFKRARPYTTAHAVPAVGAHAPESAEVDFATQIRPIFEARCTPCHFAGGKMYARLPFDRAETIYKLGTKLFTRIKAEHEQRLIREFLSQQPARSQTAPQGN
jgi:hypothetical protein